MGTWNREKSLALSSALFELLDEGVKWNEFGTRKRAFTPSACKSSRRRLRPSLSVVSSSGQSSSSSFSRFDRSNINQINVKFISLRWQSGAVETMTRQASDKSAFRGINKFLPFICATQQWFQIFFISSGSHRRRRNFFHHRFNDKVVYSPQLLLMLSFSNNFYIHLLHHHRRRATTQNREKYFVVASFVGSETFKLVLNDGKVYINANGFGIIVRTSRFEEEVFATSHY